MTSVHAVVVSFHPDGEKLRALLDALLKQVQLIHLIDNTPDADVHEQVSPYQGSQYSRVVLRRLGANKGVATGFNLGIAEAFSRGCTHVLLSDQDSVPAEGMVGRLLETYQQLTSAGSSVAVVGPDFFNEVDQRQFRFECKDESVIAYRRCRPTPSSPIIEVASVISSGALISRHAFEAVGPMLESLFIDYVDVEWCERARSKGLHCYADGRALMRHQMGEKYLRLWLFGWRTVARYGPLRLYYQARNACYLCSLSYVDHRFKVGCIWFMVRKIYAYAIFASPNRWESIKALLFGVKNGVLRRMGRSEKLPW